MTTLDEKFALENWRRVNFKRLGFSLYDATALAENPEVDFHDIEKFLREHPSCDPKTALEIVR